jgi:hypothetical protein
MMGNYKAGEEGEFDCLVAAARHVAGPLRELSLDKVDTAADH